MTNSRNNTMPDDDKALDELLSRATARPTPPDEMTQKARLAIEREWITLARGRSLRRRMAVFATAATVIVAVSLLINSWTVLTVQPVQVATLDKTVGAIYLLGEASELRDAESLEIVTTGQTIVTAAGSGISLSWGGGGSLRMDAETEVRFVSADNVELKSGRIYFDSLPHAGTASRLTISTEHGEVSHVGTQFITETDATTLVVRVREGRVSVNGRYRDADIDEGEQVRLVGSSEPRFTRVRRFGPDWEWVENTAPAPLAAGQKLVDLLDWISRETGLSYTFESEDVEALVENLDAQGDISETPREALVHSMLVNNLRHRIDLQSGEIIIRDVGR